MNKLGKKKTLWLQNQGCVFKVDDLNKNATRVVTEHNEYVGLADLGGKYDSIGFIYKHRLTQLSCIDRARGLPLSKTGCNSVSIGFSEKEQAWYGWTHRGFGKFYIGYEVKQGSICDRGNHQYPFKVETLEQAKELATDMADEIS